MRIAGRSAWISLTVVTLVLLSALALLYSKSRHYGESGYFENVALLRQLKQLDAEWELNVLKSRSGIDQNYDALAVSLTQLSSQLEKLAAEHGQHAVLHAAVERKAALIEQFKSSNSVLRNSLAFLPTAADDVRAELGPAGEGSAIAASVERLLLASVLHGHNASDQTGGKIRSELSYLEAASRGLTPARGERVAILAAHVRLVLIEQERVNDFLAAIAAVPTAARIDEIHNTLADRQHDAQSRTQRYGAFLLIFSIVLMALLLGAAVRLIRSHAVINHVNRELHDANENLAQRVEEGTRELRQITDAVSVMIFYVDDQRRFRFHNKAGEGLLELTSGEIGGRTVREVVGEAVYAEVCPWIDKALAGIQVRYEHSRVNQAGVRCDYSVQYFPRRKDDRDDQPVIGYYAMVTDITEMKRIARMQTEFVSTVSHELRTPLTSIRGSLGLVAGGVAGVLPDAAKGLIDIAKSNCERLIRLINNILDTEKIESGKMELDLKMVELSGLAAQSITANQGIALQSDVSIELLAGGEGALVNVDSDALSQVLTNLLSNAVKFSPPGGAVEVSIVQGDERVRVEVRDQGNGIPAGFRGRIFGKFSQADSSDTRQKGGTGLGLNISKAIVERLGGTIGFKDHETRGTIFFFELPEIEDRRAAVVASAPAGPGRPRVLVCENDPDIARLIGMMLDSAGYEADLAHSAAQAGELLASETPYAAMTLDLELPNQGAAALLAGLRKDERTRRLPLVMLCANSEARSQVDSDRLMIWAWLNKPIDASRLAAAMHDAVRGRVRAVGKENFEQRELRRYAEL